MPTILHFGGEGGVDTSAATAIPSDVLNGKTFFSGESGTIQEGTLSFSGNATDADVLENKTFYSNSATQKMGTIPVKVGTTRTLNASEQIQIDSGYYGSSFVITAPSITGNAASDKVLNGQTFMNSSGIEQTGSIPIRTGIPKTLNYSEEVEVINGYYGNAFTLTAPGRYGDALESHVLVGKTFMNSTTNVIGTMPDQGALNATYNANGNYNWAAGYYAAGTVTVNVPIPAGYVKMTTGTRNLNMSWVTINHGLGATPTYIVVGYSVGNWTDDRQGLKYQNKSATSFDACEQGTNTSSKACRWVCW